VSQSHANAVPVASRSRSGRMGFTAFVGRLLKPFLSGLSFRAFIKGQVVWSILKALKVKSSMNESDFLKVWKCVFSGENFIRDEVFKEMY
jgi:hypothetical protein